jgi:hypothetical protein
MVVGPAPASTPHVDLLVFSSGAGPIHRGFIEAGQDGCWSGTRFHDAHVELCFSTARVPAPFIEVSLEVHRAAVGLEWVQRLAPDSHRTSHLAGPLQIKAPVRSSRAGAQEGITGDGLDLLPGTRGARTPPSRPHATAVWEHGSQTL